MGDQSQTPNKLINEKSPYLLQHAYNPVQWHAWNDETFALAKKENKAIFLSIGYSTCHWCHVMEHESFEDKEVAVLMNEAFINIKVDREERPDIDHIYMNVCQMLTGSGGWPMTIIMTPDKKPFFAGTYFPKYSVQNRIGMLDLVPKVQEIWKNERANIYSSAEKITSELQKPLLEPGISTLDKSIIKKAYHELAARFDEEFGGFGARPKFPTPHNIIFLLRYFSENNSSEAIEMATKTLMNMRNGGLFDHIGFGFHRYSTDKEWLLPHFEKMLYDQAMLLQAFTEAYKLTENQSFRDTANQIIAYALRDLKSPEGAFYSAEDADSEGEEGKFYVWSIDEFRAASIGDSELATDYFNLQAKGNYRDEATYEVTGKNILHVKNDFNFYAQKYNTTTEDIKNRIEKIRKQLYDIRNKKIRPHLDDKILADWNGMMITSLAYAGRALKNDLYIEAAENAAIFILDKMFENGEFKHRYRDNEAGIDAMLDDYAYMISAMLELYRATYKIEYLENAIEMQRNLDQNFWDEQYYGYFINTKNNKKLIAQMKDIFDSAIPTGNSVSLHNLFKLWKITGNQYYKEYADKLVRAFASRVTDSPSAFTYLMSGLITEFAKSFEIVIVGNISNPEVKQTIDYLNSSYSPFATVVLKDNEKLNKIAPFTENMKEQNGLSIYVCKEFTCEQPVHDLNSLKEILKK